jgi:hypothetical protein
MATGIIGARGSRVGEALSARVDRVNDPLVVGLPQREVPPPRLDPQRLVANLADVTGVARAVSFCPGTADRNITAFQIERLRLELIERSGERLDVHARPHCVRRIGIKRAEGVLIAIERHCNGARFRGERSRGSSAWSRNDGAWWWRIRN